LVLRRGGGAVRGPAATAPFKLGAPEGMSIHPCSSFFFSRKVREKGEQCGLEREGV